MDRIIDEWLITVTTVDGWVDESGLLGDIIMWVVR